MKIEVLGCYGGESPECRTTSLLINGTIALDAGSLAQALSLDRQAQVRSIVLTHSHVDHVRSLPFFIENVYGKSGEGIDIYASATTIFAVRKHLFNNSSWPDFSRLPNNLLPAIRFKELTDEMPVVIDGVTFTPFMVHHLIPTFGFVLEQGGSAFLWSSDTGPTQRLWEMINQMASLQMACVDTSFDNELQNIADISFHLTPATLVEELKKLERTIPLLLHHLKPPCIRQIQAEVRAMKNPDLHFLEQGKGYEF
jgi:ribonuclease BN (tRNA processing enzyme)